MVYMPCTVYGAGQSGGGPEVRCLLNRYQAVRGMKTGRLRHVKGAGLGLTFPAVPTTTRSLNPAGLQAQKLKKVALPI